MQVFIYIKIGGPLPKFKSVAELAESMSGQCPGAPELKGAPRERERESNNKKKRRNKTKQKSKLRINLKAPGNP